MKKPKTVKVELELNEKSVKMIEKYLEEDTIKTYLENEINNHPDIFIEYSGLDNYWELIVPPRTSTINTAMVTTYKDADQAYEAGNEWINTADRFEKLDYIMETASVEFKDNFLNEIVQWMGEEDFSAFFEHIRRNWDFKTPPELDYLMSS